MSIEWIKRDMSVFEGKEFSQIKGMEPGSDEITFLTSDLKVYKMLHEQDCCEQVYLCDVCGDPSALLHTPTLVVFSTSQDGDDDSYESSTWTFYTFRTMMGTVTLRWFGSSNGYYSESVDIFELRRCSK